MAVRFFEAVLLAAFFTGVGYIVGRLIGVFAQVMIEHDANMPAIRAMIGKRSGLERSLELRVRERRKAMAALDREITELARKKNTLRQDAATLAATPDRIMRLVGEEINGHNRFLALIYNKYAEGSNGAIDPSWSIAQEIEVWANGMSDSKIELEKRFPPSFGYVVSSVTPSPYEAPKRSATAPEFAAAETP